jgi:HEAT repeat protein
MNQKKKEIDSPVSGIMVPIAIIVGGALLVWGITRMLSAESGYKKLVQELHSKTFGNKWVAAYELSKYISSKSIPEEDIPWFIDQLSTVYKNSRDPRTKNFITLTLGSLKNELALPILNDGLKSEDKDVVFSSVIGVGNFSNEPAVREKIDFAALYDLLEKGDTGLKQAIILTLASFGEKEQINKVRQFLVSEQADLRYSAAAGLVQLGDEPALRVSYELFSGNKFELPVDVLQSYRLNILIGLNKAKSSNKKELIDFAESLTKLELGLQIKTKLEETLINLKKSS